VAQTHAYCRWMPATLFLFGLGFAAWAEQPVSCHLEAAKPLSRFSSDQLALLVKLNHADPVHLARLTSILVPNRWLPDEILYSPMPRTVPQLSEEKKAIVVDLAAQVFGAYEGGRLVRWGPVSSGDRHHQTPSGVYHLNWHQRVRVSSDNPTWVMPWYFNFESRHGFGLHQYSLPGRPASHGCARMLPEDAKWLFHWGEGWKFADGTRDVIQPGTLVILLGEYDSGAPQPWLQPDWWSRGVTLPLQQIATRK
jgi:hypothetical protein